MLNSTECATASLEGPARGQGDMKRRVGATAGSSTLESSGMHGEVSYNKRKVESKGGQWDNVALHWLWSGDGLWGLRACPSFLFTSCFLRVGAMWPAIFLLLPPCLPCLGHQKGMYSPELQIKIDVFSIRVAFFVWAFLSQQQKK